MDKKRYIIEIKYSHDKKGENVEMVEIHTADIEWSMKEYQRNRQPFEWRIRHDYGSGL
tara:strand:+ start:212 stop:385 length:174 start_codon:yes stop_codon:yes gene_type:complete